MRLAIKYLKEKKEKYNINKITLLDNSIIQCEGTTKRFIFPILYTLTHGDTWYGKYGFKPYDSYNNILHEKNYSIYLNNKEIVLTKKISDVSILLEYLKKVDKFDKLSDIKKQEYVDNFHKEYDNLYIHEFFKMYIKDFTNNCKKLFKFYKDFAEKIGVKSLHSKAFYLDI